MWFHEYSEGYLLVVLFLRFSASSPLYQQTYVLSPFIYVSASFLHIFLVLRPLSCLHTVNPPRATI